MDSKYDHITYEKKVYELWENSDAFKPRSTGKKPYTVLMPPPNANASLHAGHAMYTVDDIIVRWKRMQGFSTVWVPGLDHAGLETQFVYEKHLAKQGKSRMDFDRTTLYDNIEKFVKENSGLIYEQFKRLGFSADWSRSVYTLDEQVVAQVVDTFKKMETENLVYRDEYIVNYCPNCGTTLAELEVKHEERTDPFYFIKYRLVDDSSKSVTVATVRPETIFGDTGIAVHPKDKRYTNLVGKTAYLPLINREIPIVADTAVDMGFGTGAVKITPAHDPNDFETGKRHNLESISIIDWQGRMRMPDGFEYPEIEGKKAKSAREIVAKRLEDENYIEKIDTNYQHSVTVCYKCKHDLEPLTLPNWFIKVNSLKSRVKEAVEKDQVTFHPIRFKRHMLAWLDIMHDWPISRQNVWGIRIPVWYDIDKNPNLTVVFLKNDKIVSGKIADLLSNHKLTEIKSGLQKLIAPIGSSYTISPTEPGGEYLPETDTFDTWFSSGQWPLVTIQDGELSTRFPTDFLGSLSDILKFWVSRMIMFSLYLKNEIPFRDVYLWAMVADSKGVKMSKSKGNVINPIDLIEKYGADALRMSLMYGTPAGSKILLSDDKVRAMRNFANKVWNAARFVQNFSNNAENNPDFELWYSKELPKIITKHLNSFRLDKAAEEIYHNFWHLFCDRYIEEAKLGKISSSQLTNALVNLLKLLHPFMPFVTEAIWQEMATSKQDSEKLLINSPWPKTNG